MQQHVITETKTAGKTTRYLLVLMMCLLANASLNAQLPVIKISANKRFFQTADGKPFFWLGDTGWLLFVKCSREEAVQYLDTRKAQGFNIIQVMVLHDMMNKNFYGDYALKNADASTPNVTAGNKFSDTSAYDYWDHVEYIIDEAAKRGIYMGLVPVWGGNVKAGKVNVQQAEVYAKFLAQRFKSKSNIVWLNGGDIPGTDGMDVWKMIGSTIKKYDPNHLETFHPRGRYSSSEWFHNESWLDFNMFQSGHKDYAQDTVAKEKNHFGEDNWKFIVNDYALKPVKPTLDGEPSYENIPHGLHDSLEKRWTAADIRRYAYWSVFAGGAGFTYGDNAIMQFYTLSNHGGSFGVRENWKDELTAPGATQMQYLKKLMLSKNYFNRVPAQELVKKNGERYDLILATMGKDYAMFYTWNGSDIYVNTSKITIAGITDAYWFNPRTGEKTVIYKARLNDIKAFNPPGEKLNGNDWVLIIEKSKAKISW